MPRIAHLSDLHFGAADPRALSALARSIAEQAPDLVVVTGDLTQAGRRREFEEAAAFLNALGRELLVLPGNHDAPVYALPLRFFDPWRRFRRALGAEPETTRMVATDTDGALIVGLNSARRADASLDWSRGRLSHAQIARARAALAAAPVGALRIVALHHPVLKGPGRAGAAVVGRADAALDAFAAAGADFLLTGHAHVAEAGVERLGGRCLVVVRAGTATSTRQRGEPPSYNLIDLERGAGRVTVLSLGEAGFEEAAARRFRRDAEGWREEG